ncbi:MAG: tetratricopeptide repeat protein [Pseudomonadota bacterium]
MAIPSTLGERAPLGQLVALLLALGACDSAEPLPPGPSPDPAPIQAEVRGMDPRSWLPPQSTGETEIERRALSACHRADAASYEQALRLAQAGVEGERPMAEDWRRLGFICWVGLLGFPDLPTEQREERAEQAIAAFEAAERLAPGSFVAARFSAKVHAAMGRWERERAAYLVALEAAPADCTLRADYVRRLLDDERTAAAREQLDLLLDRHWDRCEGLDRARVLEFQGRVLLAEQDLEGARRHLTAAAHELEASDPGGAAGYACPYQALGALYTQSGMQRVAARYYYEAAEVDGDGVHAQLLAALAAVAAGDGQAAARFSARSEELGGPSLAGSFRARELPYRELMDTIHAQGHIRAALLERRAPVHVLIWCALTSFDRGQYAAAGAYAALGEEIELRVEILVTRAFLALMARDTQGAAALLERAAALDADPGVQVGRGHLAVVARDYEAAMEALRPVADDPWRGWLAPWPDQRAYAETMRCLAELGMGWALANQGEHARALPYYGRILARRPDDVLALLGVGTSYTGLGRYDEAEQAFRRVLEQSPDNPYAMAELGLVEYNRGDDRAAEALFERAIEAGHADYTCPYEGLGLVYLRQGRTEQARGNFQRAIEIGPDVEYKKYNGLARIYLREGRVDEAEALLRKSIENHPWDDEAKTLLEGLRAGEP